MLARNPTSYHLHNRRTLPREYLNRRSPPFQIPAGPDIAASVIAEAQGFGKSQATAAPVVNSIPTQKSSSGANGSPNGNSAGNANTGGGNSPAAPANPAPSPQTNQPTVSPTANPGNSKPTSGTNNPSVDTGTGTGAAATPTSDSNTEPTVANSQWSTQSVSPSMHIVITTSTDSLGHTTVISSSYPYPSTTNSSNATNPNIHSAVHHGGSKNAIIAFSTILSVLFLGFALFLVRRHCIARRTQRRQQWWFTRSVSHQEGNAPGWGQVSPHDTPIAGTLSVRSSFATTYDQSNSGHNTSFESLPPVPPMAEIRGESRPLLFRENTIAYPVALYPSSEPPTSVENSSNGHRHSGHGSTFDLSSHPIALYLSSEPPSVENSSDNHRNPLHGTSNLSSRPVVLCSSSEPPVSIENSSSNHGSSAHGAASELSSQYLMFPSSPAANTSDANGIESPMAVSPFPGSGSFVFPKPPGEQLTEVNSIHSRPQSLTMPKSPTSRSGDSNTPSSKKLPRTPLAQEHSPDIPNPFVDPSYSGSASSSQVELETLETIHQSFTPFRDDQLRVDMGDSVRVLEMYSNGWAMAEMMTMSGRKKGLLPIDCLKKAGQELPRSLAAKTVSSYAGSEGVSEV